MYLTIDANILVSELNEDTGASPSLLLHPVLETLYIAEYTWNEAKYVLARRIESWARSGRLAPDIADETLESSTDLFASRCVVVAESFYAHYEREARQRIPDDPDDWHTVALALVTKTAIWTLDQKHFFGCGMAIWNSKILRAVLMDRKA
ncbi:MAG: nucleotide-binding protein, PIN domain-containing protein [Thermomicrobia bacterium]|nr:nucleotide-binding protein, PIN domain-containing protein [Thermomicrobia bacterium]